MVDQGVGLTDKDWRLDLEKILQIVPSETARICRISQVFNRLEFKMLSLLPSMVFLLPIIVKISGIPFCKSCTIFLPCQSPLSSVICCERGKNEEYGSLLVCFDGRTEGVGLNRQGLKTCLGDDFTNRTKTVRICRISQVFNRLEIKNFKLIPEHGLRRALFLLPRGLLEVTFVF